jgi:YihY family inner membrane protein
MEERSMKKIRFIKSLIIKIYHKINDRVLDYTYKVPRTAGICFAYYMIIAVIPICSLCAFFARLLNVDLTPLQQLLSKFLTAEFADIILSRLVNQNVGLSSIIVIGMSIYVVSRGIYQIYDISKNLFPATHERSFIVEYIITLGKTVAVFILLVLMITLITFFPILSSYLQLKKGVDEFYLLLVFFLIFLLLYKIIPDCYVKLSDIIKGAMSAAVLLLILIEVLQFYFSIANYTTVYGPLASVVIILMSFSFSAEVIYIGMYIMFEAHMKHLIIEIENHIEHKESLQTRLLEKAKDKYNHIKNEE